MGKKQAIPKLRGGKETTKQAFCITSTTIWASLKEIKKKGAPNLIIKNL